MTLPRAALLLLLAACVVQIWAGLHLQGLAGDGAHCLRVLLSNRRPSCLEPARWVTQMLLEAPTLVALRIAGITDTAVLAALYSLTLQLLPLLLIGACLAVLPAAERGYLLFPIAAYFVGGSSVVSLGLIEGPAATFYFWLVFYRVLFVSEHGRAWPLTLALAAPAAYVHELLAFLAPLLALACWLRGRQANAAAFRLMMLALAAWFAVVAVVQAIHVIDPNSLANRDGYVDGLLRLSWLARSSDGVNTAVLLGLLALAATVSAWRWPRAAAGIIAAFAVAACVFAAGVWLSPWLRAPMPLFYARNHVAFISVPLALAALALRHAGPLLPVLPEQLRSQGLVLLALLATATLTMQLAITRDWSRYINGFTTALHSRPGIIPWEEVLAPLPPPQLALFRSMNWGWTNPDLSLLLSGGRPVLSIIANPAVPAGQPKPWRPWDPEVPATWPGGWMFDLRFCPG